MEVVSEKNQKNVVPEGYKRTEYGLIPKNWSIEEIGPKVDLLTGNPFSSSNYSDHGVRLLRCANIKRGNTDWSDDITRYWPKITPPLRKYELQEGDVVIAMDGSLVGRSYSIIEENDLPALLLQRVARIRSESVYPYYLNYFTGSEWFVKYCDSVKTNTAVPHISAADINEFAIPLPPTLEEQRAIATALSDIDELIRSLDELIEKKKKIKRGTMQRLLTGKQRLPEFSDEWEERNIGSVADVQRGASPRPISSPVWFSNEKDVGWVRISDISDSDGKNLFETADYLSQAGINESRFLPTGSLIMSIAATVGVPVITRLYTCIHDGFVGLTNLDIDKEFLYYKLKELESDFENEGQTGSQKNINSNIVRAFEIAIPPRNEQKAIAKILSDMDAEIQFLQAKRDKYEQIKQGMMQELLTGKTRLV